MATFGLGVSPIGVSSEGAGTDARAPGFAGYGRLGLGDQKDR